MESSPHKRSQRFKEDEQSSPEEDEIEERIKVSISRQNFCSFNGISRDLLSILSVTSTSKTEK